tara:strand:- start:86 stop:754 length:669 start_codon:yes stop_codon:yes gene_type:complete
MNNNIIERDSAPDSEYGVIQSNRFKVNPNSRKLLWVVDDFYEDPMAVREHALLQYYNDDPGYLGMRTRKQFFFDGMKEKFEEILGKKITGWEEYGMNGRFQSNIAGTTLVYHCDSQKYAAAIYLNPNAPYYSGTSFYAVKNYDAGPLGTANSIRHNSHPDLDLAFNQHTFVDRTPYELVDTVGNVFNRLVIWNAGLIHSASEYCGWDIASSRLFQIFFFDAE